MKVDNFTETKEALESIGIKVVASPLTELVSQDDFDPKSPSVLFISIDEKRTRIQVDYPKTAQFTTYLDGKLGQVVMIVEEPAHKISGFKRLTYSGTDKHIYIKHDEDHNGPYFVNVTLPSKARIVETGETIPDKELHRLNSLHKYAAVVAHVPKIQNCFLIGRDEGNLFISMLPKVAASVAEAHEVLRPKTLSKNAFRVAEFFFDPVSQKESKELDQDMSDLQVLIGWNGSAYIGGREFDCNTCFDEFSENHIFTLSIRKKKKFYAIGWVLDNSGRHKPLFLNDWHKVVRNNEIPSFGNNWD